MRAKLWLAIWLIGILFPLAWLGRFSSAYRRIFNTLFGPEWMHVFMHMVLFAVFALLLIVALKRPLDARTIRIVTASVLVVGLIQEGLQLFTREALPEILSAVSYSAFDVGIDFLGAMTGIAIIHIIQHRRGLSFNRS